MKKILIASNNQGKILEIKQIFAETEYDILTPQDTDLPEDFDPEETGDTFAANALLKAQAYSEETGLTTLADDSGLMVDALNGRPGVLSKRYGKDDHDRNTRLLGELEKVEDDQRTARFICAMCLYDPITSETITAEGTVEGKISLKPRGKDGFGYDPVFIPKDYPSDQTFAELGTDEKNKISHRGRALESLRKSINS